MRLLHSYPKTLILNKHTYHCPLPHRAHVRVEHAAYTCTHIIKVGGQEPGLCSSVARDCNIQVWLVLEEPGY